jgi:hypothetical protein
MTMFGTHPSRVTGDGLPKGRALPVIHDLTLAYALSLLVAVLMAVVSVAGLVFGSRGPYGVDIKIAAGVATGPAGVLVPGFLAQDARVHNRRGAAALFGVTPVGLAVLDVLPRLSFARPRPTPARDRRRHRMLRTSVCQQTLEPGRTYRT